MTHAEYKGHAHDVSMTGWISSYPGFPTEPVADAKNTKTSKQEVWCGYFLEGEQVLETLPGETRSQVFFRFYDDRSVALINYKL